jgi:protein TonB
MFEPPTVPRRRPMFAVSAAAHAALALALFVPPLLATPEPPEPNVRMLPFFPVLPVHIGDAPPPARQNLLRGVRGEGLAARASDGAARPALTQPSALTELLPAPTGEEAQLPIEETGERSEPGNSEIGRRDGTQDGDGSGCPGCNAISAETPGVTPPVALESAALAYPELARRAHLEGVVILEAIIGADGSVRDVRILRGAHPLLDTAALEGVRLWRYRPASIGARPVAVFLRVVITFSLRNP